MKKIIFMLMVIIMCFGAVGCAGNTEKEEDIYINGISEAKEMMEQGPISKEDWTVVIPDYKTIFKNGNIVTESSSTKCFDYAGIFSVRINNITEEEYDLFVGEASKIYSDVISESSTTFDGAPFKGYHALDSSGLYQINLGLYEDAVSETLECSIIVYYFEEPKEV